MQLNSQKTCDVSNRQTASDIRKAITLANSQVHKMLANPNEFASRIKDLNSKAIIQIKQQALEESIVYLEEAQKNLEYAASCGHCIDLALITATLKNLACAYQRLWELTTCYDYMEAFIYNLRSRPPEIVDMPNATAKLKEAEIKAITKTLNWKLKLALNNLQFSALSSQLGKHEHALKMVSSSIDQFEALCQICKSYQLCLKGKTSQMLQGIIKSIHEGPAQTCLSALQMTKTQLQRMKNHVFFFSFDTSQVEALSMGDIMQVNCLSVEEESEQVPIGWFISQLGLTYIAIYVSCCFFAKATEMRLIAQTLPEEDSRGDLQLAEIHHLHSIKIASGLVLIQSQYLAHIIKSFRNNFNIDILTVDVGKVRQQLLLKSKQQQAQKQMDKKDMSRRSSLQKKQECKKKETTGPTVSSEQKQPACQGQIPEHTQEREPIPRRLSQTQSLVIKPKKSKIRIEGQPKRQKEILTSRSIKTERSVSKNPKKQKVKNQKVINEYLMQAPANRKKGPSKKEVLSPKNKPFLKQNNLSKSKSKLKLKGLKSPGKH